MDAATATLRDSSPPGCGMLTVMSQRAMRASLTPCPSWPITHAQGCGKGASGNSWSAWELVATRGTAAAIAAAGIPVTPVNKVQEGRPHVVDLLKNGEVSLVLNSVEEKRGAIADSRSIRTTALAQRVTYYTTIAGALAAVEGMRSLAQFDVYSLQELHAGLD